MNQTVSEKTQVDYLFVVQNSEPKQFVFLRCIGINSFLGFLT